MKIPDALEQLNASRRQEFTTADLATLLHLKRSQAAKLMKDWDADLVGRVRVLPRRRLIEVLEAVERSGEVRVELDRRARQVESLQEADELAPARELKLPVPQERRYIERAEQLPEGVHVTETDGRRSLVVPFESLPTLLARFYELARVANFDPEGLERLLQRDEDEENPDQAGSD